MSKGAALPAELDDALRAARRVEDAAENRHQQLAAVRGSSVLLLEGQRCGHAVTAMAAVLGLTRYAASARISAIREHAPAHLGLELPAARPPDPLDVLAQPAGDRDVLTMDEALKYAGVSFWTLRAWRRAGLLPGTTWPRPRFALYLRADLDRVMSAPRYRGQGRSHAAVRQQIVRTPSE